MSSCGSPRSTRSTTPGRLIAQLRSAGAGLLPWLAPELVAVVRR